MPLRAIARLIQTMLYAQRFFPYYVYNILGGIEEDGEFIRLCVSDMAFLYRKLGMASRDSVRYSFAFFRCLLD